MKSKKIFAVVSIALVAVVVAIAVFLPSRPKPGVSAVQFETLKPGMTQAEVERLLHGPPRNDLGHAAIIWLPQASGKRISAEIGPGSPAFDLLSREEVPKGSRRDVKVASAVDFFPQLESKDGHQGVWVTRTGLIAVYFGRDNRLRRKYTSVVHEIAPPSVADRLTSSLGVIRRSLGL